MEAGSSDTAAAQAEALRNAAQAARAAGDAEAAWARLRGAREHGPEGAAAFALDLLEAELLMDAGRLDAAETLLGRLGTDAPESYWPPFKLAELAMLRGDREGAERHLEAAAARDPDRGNLHLWLKQGERRLESGRAEEGVAILEDLTARHPESYWPPFRLAQIAWEAGDGARAERFLTQAEARDPEGENPHIALLRVELLETAGQGAAAEVRLAEALARQPRAPALLRRLYAYMIPFTDPDLLFAAHARVRAAVPADLGRDLDLQFRIATARYDSALRRLRRLPPPLSAADAGRLAAALFGLQRPEAGLRYLRRAAERHRGSPWLLAFHIDACLRLGRLAEAEDRLDAAEGRLSAAEILSRRLALAGHRGDTEAVAEAYAALRAQGRLGRADREILGRTIFAALDPAESETYLARTGHPMEGSRSLHRDGPVGALLVEFELECRALAEAKAPPATPADWVRARPGSTMAAIRLIEAWRRGAEAGLADRRRDGPAGTPAPIPRQILQYWDGPELTEAEAARLGSWARASPGFAYRRFDRAAARGYLTALGPDWAKAFRMARTAEQEVDLLRLAVLSAEGGIWADADSARIAPLRCTLGPGTGLVVHRAPLDGGLSTGVVAVQPRHPVLLRAARQARTALLNRDSETAWSKTGAGLLTRALAQYLTVAGREEAGRMVRVLDREEVAGEIVTGLPLDYRGRARHWGRIDPERTALWQRLHDAL